MKLFLSSPNTPDPDLRKVYSKAFREAVELYLVSAYLTSWSNEPELNSRCKHLTFLVGRDFGITRKAACRSVLSWLPDKFRSDFMVAESIGGFHPKAMFWRDARSKCHMLIGSSNLTEAAVSSNVEANVYAAISAKRFREADDWVRKLADSAVPIDDGWLTSYQEASWQPVGHDRGSRRFNRAGIEPVTTCLELPDFRHGRQRLRARKKSNKAFEEIRRPLLGLFRRAARGKLENSEVYKRLRTIWGQHESRFQGRGWEIRGARSNLQLFCQAFMEIYNARDNERDQVVQKRIDWMAEEEVPTRGSLLSEMLCHFFPDRYPVLNKPIRSWYRAAGYRLPRGASEGVRYLFLAKTLRAAIKRAPSGYPARNLAELDFLLFAWSERQ